MSVAAGPECVNDGLVFSFDARNTKCYSGSGTSCSDSIIQNAGLVEGGATFSSTGYFSFVTDDYLRFPNDTSLDNQAFSVEVWAKTNATTQNGFWFEKGTVNSQYSLFQEGASIRWRSNVSGTGLVNMVSPTTATYIDTVDWFHIVGTCITGSQVVYINGASAGTGTTAGTFSTNTGGMSIGAYGGYTGSHSYYYNGDIAIVRVYNRVLTAPEVDENFNAIRGRFGI